MSNRIIINASGSSGNNLIIESNGKKLLIDVGIDHKKILNSVNYKIDDWSGVIVSHKHQDHVKSLDYFIKLGIPCYANQDVCNKHKGCNLLPKLLKLEGFKVQNFELIHNVPNNAFVIDTEDEVRVLYCTDTEYIPKIVKNVNYAIIECNYDYNTIIDNMLDDNATRSSFGNHQELETCIEYLNKIKHLGLNHVILWHLSESNINRDTLIDYVKEKTGIESISYAKKGDCIELNSNKF